MLALVDYLSSMDASIKGVKTDTHELEATMSSSSSSTKACICLANRSCAGYWKTAWFHPGLLEKRLQSVTESCRPRAAAKGGRRK